MLKSFCKLSSVKTRNQSNRRLLAATVPIVLIVAIGTVAGASGNTPIGVAGTAPVYKTVGPNGQHPVSATTVKLTSTEISALQAGHYTAAMLWPESATFTSAVAAGASAEFAHLGISVVSTSEANFNATTQVNQIQTVEAQKPSVAISLPVDQTTEASAYRALGAQGTKLVFLSDVPTGFKYPTDYAGMVTDDLANMGRQAAILLGKAMHGRGNAAMIYYDASYFVTNERDAAFRTWLRKLYPKINLVAQEGFADPSKVQSVATAMMERNPKIQGIYVSWSSGPADEVIAGLRSIGASPKIRVVTDDLDSSIDAGLVTGNYLAGIVADQPYQLGVSLAKEAGLAILGDHVPIFAIVKAIAVEKSNLLKAWKATLDQSPPAAIVRAFH